MDTTELMRVVDHAASMNDRWLFLAAFFLLLLLCGVVIRWLVKQLQGLITDQCFACLSQILTLSKYQAFTYSIYLNCNNLRYYDCKFDSFKTVADGVRRKNQSDHKADHKAHFRADKF